MSVNQVDLQNKRSIKIHLIESYKYFQSVKQSTFHIQNEIYGKLAGIIIILPTQEQYHSVRMFKFRKRNDFEIAFIKNIIDSYMDHWVKRHKLIPASCLYISGMPYTLLNI